MSRQLSRILRLVTSVIVVASGTALMAHAERLPLPAKGARLLEAHSYVRAEQVSIERPDYTTWLTWSSIPESEEAFQTRKPGVLDVRYIFTSGYFPGDDASGPAGISIEIDGIRVNARESGTEEFDVDGLEPGETTSLGSILRTAGDGQYSLGALVAIPAGPHLVRVVTRPAGIVGRSTDGQIYVGVQATRLRDQNLTVLVFG